MNGNVLVSQITSKQCKKYDCFKDIEVHIIGMVIAQMKRRMIKINISSRICSSKDNIEFP